VLAALDFHELGYIGVARCSGMSIVAHTPH
jgi:hypothetical protein